jgi:PBSX family phage terminase large subunit
MKLAVLPKQKRLILSPTKFPGYVAGIGSGKTYAGCLRALFWSTRGDGVIVAPTYPMLRDVAQRTFFELCEKMGATYTFIKSEEKVIMPDGHIILFRSGDAPERLRGPNLTWGYLDEGAMMVERVWSVLLGRLRVGHTSAWITTTPAGYNWVWKYWVEKQSPSYELIQSSSRENKYLPSDFISTLEESYSSEYAAQEIEGQFVQFEGLVYSEFNRAVHVVDPLSPPESWGRVRSIDFGYTNPFVCLWGATDGDGRLFIYDEHYKARTLLKDHADAIHARDAHAPAILWSVADHDAQDTAELHTYGVSTHPAQKDVGIGIQRVKERLRVRGDGRARVFISSNCVNTIREFGAYRWEPSKEGRAEKEQPVKESDHALDALRYMIMELDHMTTPQITTSAFR